jgi:hypothetical protein
MNTDIAMEYLAASVKEPGDLVSEMSKNNLVPSEELTFQEVVHGDQGIPECLRLHQGFSLIQHDHAHLFSLVYLILIKIFPLDDKFLLV